MTVPQSEEHVDVAVRKRIDQSPGGSSDRDAGGCRCNIEWDHREIARGSRPFDPGWSSQVGRSDAP